MRSISSASARSHSARAGTLTPAHAFERLAIRPRERDGGIPRHARRQAMPSSCVQLGEAPLDAFVHVAEPLLEPEHFLADDRETKMPGLDDARVHGTDRNLVHAVARDAHERIVVRSRRPAAGRRSSAQRAESTPPATRHGAARAASQDR